jgi:hypothetical protein
VPCQPFVDERIVRIQEFRDAAVLAQRAADEELGFPLERLKKTQVIVGIAVRIDDDFLDAPQIQPLGRKVVNQRADSPGIGQHTASFGFERRRIRELPALGQPEQTLVGMLLHRKNDNREATSMSLSRYVSSPDAARVPAGGSL